MAYSSSIDTGLSNIPDLTNITQPNQLSYQFISIYNAISILAQGIDAYTGNTPVTNDNPATNGSVTGAANTGYFIAGVAIAAGRLCTINAAGNAVLADSGTAALLARGVAVAAATVGAQVTLQLFGSCAIFAAGTFTKGSTYYLGVGGLFTITPPATGFVQAVAWAASDTTLFMNPALVNRPAPVTT